MNPELLWPRYSEPGDLSAIEAEPLDRRGLAQSTYELLTLAARQWPDRIAISVMPDGRNWPEVQRRTYRELFEEVNRIANLLRSFGVRRDTAVAIISPNCAEMISAVLGAQAAGIAATINPALPLENVGELIRNCGARVVIGAGPHLDERICQFVGSIADSGLVEKAFLLRPTRPSVAPNTDQTRRPFEPEFLSDSALNHPGIAFLGEHPKASDLAAIFHTGGTTGVPKLAAHTHHNEITNAWMVAANNLLAEQTAIFAGLPLFHVNALIVTVLAPLMRGQHVTWAGPLGYRDQHLLENFWKVVEHQRLSVMSAVPTVYASLAQTPVDADISSMRLALVGASPLPEAVRRGFEARTGIALLQGYGLTEGTCVSALSFPDQHRAGSVGQRLPYQNIKAVRVDDDGTWHDLPQGDVGTLAISGPTVFAGYVRTTSGGARVVSGGDKVVDGWLDTGDRGRIDKDGFVYLSGRAKDLIIRGGHNIDPAVIEAVMLEHPDVTGANAVGRPDPRSGEVPVVYVTVAPGSETTEGELLRWARAAVGEPAARPTSITILDSLPITAVGKPSKLPLRADAISRAVQEALADVAGVKAIDVSADSADPIVTVTTTVEADHKSISTTLDSFTFRWHNTRDDPPAAEEGA